MNSSKSYRDIYSVQRKMATSINQFVCTLLRHVFRPNRSTLLTQCNTPYQFNTQVRTKYVDWKMRKDHKKRQCVKEFGMERMLLNSIRKNHLLPRELKEDASKQVEALPRNSNIIRVRNRCMITSRPRGTYRRWRVSRIVFRSLADYNKLSGVTRSCW